MQRGLLVILGVLLCWLQFRLWSGKESSIQSILRLNKVVQLQTTEIQTLTQRNRQLEAEVQGLKHNFRAFEERARTELGMIKPGETFCLIVDSQK